MSEGGSPVESAHLDRLLTRITVAAVITRVRAARNRRSYLESYWAELGWLPSVTVGWRHFRMRCKNSNRFQIIVLKPRFNNPGPGKLKQFQQTARFILHRQHGQHISKMQMQCSLFINQAFFRASTYTITSGKHLHTYLHKIFNVVCWLFSTL